MSLGMNDADSLTTEWQLDVRSWLLRLFAWDGALPAGVLLVPSLVGLVLPNNRGAIEITAVVLPIVAFFIRFRVGKHHIESNNCAAAMKILQLVVLCVAILLLMLVDAFVVLLHVMPWQAGAVTRGDLHVLGIIASIYLTLMGLALYPGRRLVRHTSPWAEMDDPRFDEPTSAWPSE
jgi:hypothetical protein